MSRNTLSFSHRLIAMGAIARTIGDPDLIRRSDDATTLAVQSLAAGVPTGAVQTAVDAITSEMAARAHRDRIPMERIRDAVGDAFREHRVPDPEACGMALDAVRHLANPR